MESVRTRCWSVSVRKSRWCRRSSPLAVAVTWATSASRTESTSTENSSFMLTFIFTVAPRPCAASCPAPAAKASGFLLACLSKTPRIEILLRPETVPRGVSDQA